MSFDIFQPIFDPIGCLWVDLEELFGGRFYPGCRVLKIYYRKRKKLCRK